MKLGLQLRDVSRDSATTALGETLGQDLSGDGSAAPRPAGSSTGHPWSPATGPRRWSRAGRALLALSLGASVLGCGYGPVYAPGGPRYEVLAGDYRTSSFEAVQATVAGVRSELGAAEALGKGFPRVVVEVLRVDERSIGVSSTSNGPLARGAEIVVVGRAQVVEADGKPPRWDTGDMSRAAQYAAGASPTADAEARGRAVRDAGRALGKALGRAVLGLPEPAQD